jgi:hypothetical protein
LISSDTFAVAGAGFTRRRQRRVLAVAVALAGVLLAGCGTGTDASKPADQTYGGLPTFLPKASITPDSILTGTAARPALTTEGDAVRVRLPRASLLATVTGPQVPGEGLPYQTDATTCTWTVTLTSASAPVPIVIADFTSIDHLGRVYHPTVVPGSPAPPATLAPGHTVTFELRAVMAVGEGLMRWAPVDQRIVASWDFEVEND